MALIYLNIWKIKRCYLLLFLFLAFSPCLAEAESGDKDKSGPDLVVSKIYFDDDRPSDGDTIKIYAVIENKGKENVTTSFLVSFEADEDIDIDRIRVQGLKAGSNITLKTKWETFFQFYGEGNHLVRVVVDTNDDVTETNESNNVLTKSIYFKPWWDRNDPSVEVLFAFSLIGIAIFVALVYHPFKDYLRLKNGGEEKEERERKEALARPKEREEKEKIVVVQNIKEYYRGGKVEVKDSVVIRSEIGGSVSNSKETKGGE